MIHELLQQAITENASDLHLVSGFVPFVRVHGELRKLQFPTLESLTIESAIREICDDELWQKFLKTKNLDFAPRIPIEDRTQRFRANYFINDDSIGACFRVIPSEIPDLNWANFPGELANKLASLRNGMVLLSGVTGSGKTTTLAMIVNLLVERGGYRIITVEDPVEYIFPNHSNTIVTQRQVGRDVQDFADGLKYGLRQDPDVILVGEIRDLETARMALSAAETGHLVFSTLHTRDAKGAISRFADLFPQNSQSEVRSQLAMSLRAVISQHLIPSSLPGAKRELALEVMFNSNPIAAAIRQGKLESIDNYILTGKNDGMTRFADSIQSLLKQGKITTESAARFV